MPFPESVRVELFVACNRRCCVCHRFCDVKMEIDHIVQKKDDGEDILDNAIAVCFDCHAEIHHYNPNHPKGSRFTPPELKMHRDQWLDFCRNNTTALAEKSPSNEGGSLERLLSELRHNLHVVKMKRPSIVFEIDQFSRAISDGVFVWLKEENATAISKAYSLIGEFNNRSKGLMSVGHTGHRSILKSENEALLPNIEVAINNAINALENDKTRG